MLAPRAETPVADVVGTEAAEEKSKEQPLQEDLDQVFFGVDPQGAAVEVADNISNYIRNDLGVQP